MLKEKIAIISDIHGNSWALQSVLNDMRSKKIDQIFNLGDSLYGLLDPIGTYDLIIKNHIASISGNEDRIIIDNLKDSKNNTTLSYVRNLIDQDILNWLKNLNETLIFDDFFLCHGTPSRDDLYLIEKVNKFGIEEKNINELKNEIDQINQKIICCGHSHIPNIIKINSNQIIINPGSIGLQAYEDDIPIYHKIETKSPHAKYCIIENLDSEYKFDFINVKYDWKKASSYAKKNNRDDWSNWLETGFA